MRHWSATQPDHLKISLLPAEDLASWLSRPVWKLELFNQDPALLHHFMAEVVEQLPFTRDWAAPYAVELVQPGCSKGNRLAQWAASEGIAMENVVAFGDNNNDISMFEQVGWRWPWATRRHRSRRWRIGSPPITTKTASRWRCSAGFCPPEGQKQQQKGAMSAPFLFVSSRRRTGSPDPGSGSGCSHGAALVVTDGALALGTVVVALLAVVLVADLALQRLDVALGPLHVALKVAELFLHQVLLAAAIVLGQEAGIVGADP